MKMSQDLDQWLFKPQQTSSKNVDPLAAFRKMTISTPESATKFRLPSILTSDNSATWLATRKNANDNNLNLNVPAKTCSKGEDADISKWLLKPQNKMETDLVTLTDSTDLTSKNPWLASSVMTTSLNSLPGNFTLPEKISNSNINNWLLRPKIEKVNKLSSQELEGWLVVPGENCAKFSNKKYENSLRNPFEEWERNSVSCQWVRNENSKVEEWLRNALEEEVFDDTEIDDKFDDFEDCSIEVISQ